MFHTGMTSGEMRAKVVFLKLGFIGSKSSDINQFITNGISKQTSSGLICFQSLRSKIIMNCFEIYKKPWRQSNVLWVSTDRL